MAFGRAVELKSPAEIAAMREVCRLAADTLMAVGELIAPGVSTEDINQFVHRDTLAKGAVPAPLNYRSATGGASYPKSVCTSVNDVICHGIPNAREKLRPGDIVNVDITHIYKGFHGDTSATFYVGTPGPEARHITEVARACLAAGIGAVRPGARLGDIGAAIEALATSEGCSVVRDFVGHGIGRRFHEKPEVRHYGPGGRGLRLQAGMIFTIEPMINLGGHASKVLADGWTAVTADKRLSAQFEHTLLVTPLGCDILTARPGPLRNSEELVPPLAPRVAPAR